MGRLLKSSKCPFARITLTSSSVGSLSVSVRLFRCVCLCFCLSHSGSALPPSVFVVVTVSLPGCVHIYSHIFAYVFACICIYIYLHIYLHIFACIMCRVDVYSLPVFGFSQCSHTSSVETDFLDV